MKRILLFLMLVLAMQTSRAQLYDIYIPSGVDLTDNQWHHDGYSIVEANNNRYLVVSPNSYNYYTLMPFDFFTVGRIINDAILSYCPYFYNNVLGWYVEGRYRSYFVYPYGTYVVLSYRPVFYDYYFAFRHVLHLNMRSFYWHRRFYTPRPLPHRQYNGRYGSRPNPPRGGVMHNRPPQRIGDGVRINPSHRSGGGMQNRPPQSPKTGITIPQRSGGNRQGRPSGGDFRSGSGRSGGSFQPSSGSGRGGGNSGPGRSGGSSGRGRR